jgi:plastocyanin
MTPSYPIRVLPFPGCVALLALLTMTCAYGQTSVKGKAIFKGTAPKLKTISMDADPVCAAKHSSGPVYAETLIVKADGSLKNVFVYVSKGLEGKTFPAPAAAVILDQNGCMYAPHVFGILAGQQLKVVNSDATTHNVHAMAETNEEFNVGQHAGQPPIVKTFPKPEVTIPLICNQHPWMKAVAHVISNPYFAVSDADGAFEIKGLPAGTYTITAIHEKYGSSSQTVTVAAGKATAPLTFTFSAGTARQVSPLQVLPAILVEHDGRVGR